jgi:hypothetical protein
MSAGIGAGVYSFSNYNYREDLELVGNYDTYLPPYHRVPSFPKVLIGNPDFSRSLGPR